MADDLTCAVCGESVSDPALLSDCRLCGSVFHLNPRADVEGIDCGDVWTGDAEAPALQFYCRPCIGRAQTASSAASGAAGAAGPPPAPPGMPPLPPGAPPGMLEAMAGWATPPDAPGAVPHTTSEPGATLPPSLPPRPRRRRRFRRVDRD